RSRQPLPRNQGASSALTLLSRRDWPRGLSRSRFPVVVASVPINDRELVRIQVVETIEIDRYVVSADLLQMATPEAVNAAVFEKEALRNLRPPFVDSETVFPREERESFGFHEAGGRRDLGANAAIAPGGPFGRIRHDREADRTAVAASEVLS